MTLKAVGEQVRRDFTWISRVESGTRPIPQAELLNLKDRISSYSPDGGKSCVEVGWTLGTAAVRDSTQRGLGYLTFEPQAWEPLTSALKL
jgi:hypothetical protein